MEKTSPNVMGVESKANSGRITGTNQQYNPGSVRFLSIFFTLRESRRAPDPALPRVRSSPLRLHPWRLDSEALRLLQHWGSDISPEFQTAIPKYFRIEIAARIRPKHCLR